MADIVELMAFADQRIKNNDIEFTEKSRCCLALLKSLGILSHQRAVFDMYDTQALLCGLL